jgi:hypothetical protein
MDNLFSLPDFPMQLSPLFSNLIEENPGYDLTPPGQLPQHDPRRLNRSSLSDQDFIMDFIDGMDQEIDLTEIDEATVVSDLGSFTEPTLHPDVSLDVSFPQPRPLSPGDEEIPPYTLFVVKHWCQNGKGDSYLLGVGFSRQSVLTMMLKAGI